MDQFSRIAVLVTLTTLLVCNEIASTSRIKVKIEPTELDTLIGRSLKVICTMRSRDVTNGFNSKNLTFMYEFRNLRIRFPVNETYIRRIENRTIHLEHPPLTDEDAEKIIYITCVDIKEIKDAVESSSVRVYVKRRHEIPRITEWQVNNWDRFRFNWETNEDRTKMFKMKYEAWIWNEMNDYHKCSIDQENSCTLEYPYNFASPRPDQRHFLYFVVNGSVNTTNSGGVLETISSEVMKIELNDALKPGPVYNISISEDDKSVNVSFRLPKLNQSIIYELSIICTNDNIPLEFTDKKNTTRKSELVSEPLVGLPPNSNCKMSITGISEFGGKWSESSSVDFKTMEKVPLEAPEVCTGGFQVVRENGTERVDVIVYFKPLSEERARGKVIAYQARIQYVNSNTSRIVEVNQSEITNFQISLRNISTYAECEISINARTGVGYNETLKMSKIKFSKRRNELVIRKKFTVVALNDTAVRASWRFNDDDDDNRLNKKIFLFWCRGRQATRTCQDVLNWKEFSLSSATLDDVITFDGGAGRFIFGTGMERIDGGETSGIVWTDCLYDIRSSPSKPEVAVVNRSSTNVVIIISNQLTCLPGRQYGLVDSIIFTYCSISTHADDDDDDDDGLLCRSEVQTLKVDRFVTMVTLEHLIPSRRYLIVAESVTQVGLRSENVTLQIDIEAADQSIDNSLFVIISVVCCIVVVFVVAVIVLQLTTTKWNGSLFKKSVRIVVPPKYKQPTCNGSSNRSDENGRLEGDHRSRSRFEENTIATLDLLLSAADSHVYTVVHGEEENDGTLQGNIYASINFSDYRSQVEEITINEHPNRNHLLVSTPLECAPTSADGGTRYDEYDNNSVSLADRILPPIVELEADEKRRNGTKSEQEMGKCKKVGRDHDLNGRMFSFVNSSCEEDIISSSGVDGIYHQTKTNNLGSSSSSSSSYAFGRSQMIPLRFVPVSDERAKSMKFGNFAEVCPINSISTISSQSSSPSSSSASLNIYRLPLQPLGSELAQLMAIDLAATKNIMMDFREEEDGNVFEEDSTNDYSLAACRTKKE